MLCKVQPGITDEDIDSLLFETIWKFAGIPKGVLAPPKRVFLKRAAML